MNIEAGGARPVAASVVGPSSGRFLSGPGTLCHSRCLCRGGICYSLSPETLPKTKGDAVCAKLLLCQMKRFWPGE